MAAATESKLGALHDKMATVMATALDQLHGQQVAYDQAMELAKDITGDEDAIMPAAEPNLNPALLSVIERFLTNNKITCVPEEGNAMGDLERRLAQKKERKALKLVGGTSHTDM